MINLIWEKATITKNLKDELQRHPELRPLNTKLNTLYSKSRTKLKALAEKHDIKEFMNKSGEIIKHFQEVVDEVPTFTDFSYSTFGLRCGKRSANR